MFYSLYLPISYVLLIKYGTLLHIKAPIKQLRYFTSSQKYLRHILLTKRNRYFRYDNLFLHHREARPLCLFLLDVRSVWRTRSRTVRVSNYNKHHVFGYKQTEIQ